MGSKATKKKRPVASLQDVPIYSTREIAAMSGFLMQKAKKNGLEGMSTDEQIQLRLLATWYYG